MRDVCILVARARGSAEYGYAYRLVCPAQQMSPTFLAFHTRQHMQAFLCTCDTYPENVARLTRALKRTGFALLHLDRKQAEQLNLTDCVPVQPIFEQTSPSGG